MNNIHYDDKVVKLYWFVPALMGVQSILLQTHQRLNFGRKLSNDPADTLNIQIFISL